MPQKLNYKFIKQCFKKPEDNEELTCMLLKALRIRINSHADSYNKMKIAIKYLDLDFHELSKTKSKLI